MSRTITRSRPWGGVLRNAVLLGFGLYCAVPLLWLLLAPTKSDSELVGNNPLSFGNFGAVADAWSNLADYNNGVVYSWIWNTIIYTGAALILTIVAAIPAGYALAVKDVPGRRTLLMATLISMVVPPTALVLPLFLEINFLGLTDTAWAVILPSAFFPFGVYLAFVYFSTSLPLELLEAAKLDGCSELRVFTHVALPLARPIVGLVLFFCFVASWNNYFLPYVMLSKESLYNLPVGIGSLVASSPALNPSLGGASLPIRRPEAALIGVVAVLPIAIAFIWAQRYLVRGIFSGSLKG